MDDRGEEENLMSRRVKGWRSWLVYGHKLRKIIQYGFFLTVIWIGVQFYLWYKFYQTGGKLFSVSRPAGVEGFLPISALINLKYWILTGIFTMVHPSALVIFLAIISMSLIFKKSFCGFVCPVGLISEWFWKLSHKLFGKKASAPWGWRLPKWIDYPLRSIKYLLLAFFVNAILLLMSSSALESFINSPYNKVADVKMLLFFTDMSGFALGVILLLAVVSLFIANFWCRYLCPYGALLGLVSFLSPVKIRRNIPTCTDCLACTKVCPAMIQVHKETIVRSDECMGCLACVDICPVEKTLEPVIAGIRKPISGRTFAIGAVAIFLAFYIAAIATGHWQNNISQSEYIYHIGNMNNMDYGHPGAR